ncbi:spermatogenesis-associated protein 31E1-like [Equus przewalskii]|uniref:Spermatogenesis-associated protein 31E1-like n=1 Tax=Equus przewalskii TaxID=9798 RepID=A0ABM4L977_EQUPR
METPILYLKSTVATCLSSSPASWVIGTILRILYGLGLFLLFFPPPKRNLPSQLTYKRRNVRKRQVEPRGRSSKSRKKRGAWKAYRAGRKDLAEVGGLMSLLQSSPGRLSCKGCFHHLSSQDSPGEVCKTASARVRQPCGKPVEGAPLTTTPALSLALLTQRTLPLASTLPAEPPSALTRTPLGPVATSSAPAHSCWPFPNSGHGRMSCRIEFLSRWNVIKVLFFPGHHTSSPSKGPCPATDQWPHSGEAPQIGRERLIAPQLPTLMSRSCSRRKSRKAYKRRSGKKNKMIQALLRISKHTLSCLG